MSNITETLSEEPTLDPIAISESETPKTNNPAQWKADWLLSKFHSSKWILKKEGSYKEPDTGEWKNTQNIYWNCSLPNKNKLNDKIYERHLVTVKKIVFLARQGPLLSGNGGTNTETTRSEQQYALAQSLILITRWMINKGYQPELYGFEVLTKADLETFVSEGLYGRQMLDGSYHLINQLLYDAKEKGIIHQYLVEGRIDYPTITEEIGYLRGNENPTYPSYKIQYLLHKYESDTLPEWIDFKYSKGRELPSHRAVKFITACNEPISISSLGAMLTGFRILGIFSNILPDELSGLEWCAHISVQELGNKYGYSPKKRTPTIPIATALEYLDKALAWVVDFGPELVKIKRSCDIQLKYLLESNESRKDHFAKQVKVNISSTLENKLKQHGLKIERYNAHASSKDNSYIRNNMTIENAVDCLVAASFIIINTFACKRISEVLNLTANCARPALDGGWELVFGLRKASPSEALSLIGRPIPDVAYQAIELLNDLKPIDTISRGNNPDLDPLFLQNYRINRNPNKANQCSMNKMCKLFEIFADIVEIRPNDKGQRWYIRSHELRRFFAISYFWHHRFAGLPALSWFMGHSDIEHTIRYVTEEIAGAELPEEEARYAIAYLQEQGEESIPGLDMLSADVKMHFDTDNLYIIDERHLEDYLIECFKKNYRIVKHGYGAKIVYIEEHHDYE
ncbi:MAG: hypothetical protein MI976_08480 [Pseudomonadales bacterium]|nr:hypothetical protein [Pseudomonadales bacterium]